MEGLVRAAETSDLSELKKGLQRGASSLAQKTVGGVANSASLITTTISTAGSALAMDKEYKLRRAERRAERAARVGQWYARNGRFISGGLGGLFSGLETAGGSVIDGVVDGVSGAISAPLEGYKSGGVRGGVRGAGRGVVGLIVKPVVGLSDAATDVLQGIHVGSGGPSSGGGGGGGGGGSGGVGSLSLLTSSSSSSSSSDAAGLSGFSSSSSLAMAASTSSSSSSSDSEASSLLVEGTVVDGRFVAQVRPRRAFYGAERAIRAYHEEDAFAVLLLARAIHSSDEAAAVASGSSSTSSSSDNSSSGGAGGGGGGGGSGSGGVGTDGEEYLDHLNLGRFVLLISTARILIVDDTGRVHLTVFLRQVACCEVRRDGILLHLFDPVVVRASTKGHGKYGGPPEETLVRFIKCSNPARRAMMDERIQRALRREHER